MSICTTLPRVTGTEFSDIEQAQGELSLARVAIAEGDLKHGANHVAGAIAYAPALPEVHEVLAGLAARSEDGRHPEATQEPK